MTDSPTTHPIPPEALKHDYPAAVFPTQEYRPPEYLAYLERAAAAVKTVRLILYLALVGLVLLAAYGFFLVYQLTIDSHRVVEQMVRMTEQMQSMSRVMSNMHDSIADMRSAVIDMRGSMAEMKGTMANMDSTMTTLSATTNHMANTVALIQHSARNLDASVGPAANAMNSFMPFNWGGNRYPGAPPYAPPAR